MILKRFATRASKRVSANIPIQYENSLDNEVNLKLVESITNNTKHYIDLFSDAVDRMMPQENKELTYVLARSI